MIITIVGTTKKQMRVHILVCMAFHGMPPDNKYQVNHIDGNKQNNQSINLEWVTPQQNMKHATDTGLRKYSTKSSNARSVAQIDMNGNIINTFDSIQNASISTDISKGNICSVCRGDRPLAGGFMWRYV